MPRIRTIKPIHHTDKKLPEISLQAHLLWVLNWCYSDDAGIFENDPYLIRSNNFPRRTDIRIEQIVQWLDQLVKARFIIPFTYNGDGYYINRTFNTHQKIDRKQDSKIPKEIIRQLIGDRSSNDRDQSALYSTVLESTVKESNGEDIGAPAAPIAKAEILNVEKKKKFTPPSLDEVKAYFKKLVGDPKSPKYWPQDKCDNEANDFLDFYDANGWVQGKAGKPIKNWQAACRLWIRRALKNEFGKTGESGSTWQPAEAKEITKPPAPPPKIGLPKIAQEINYFYDKFLEDQITIISLEVLHYDFLKQNGLISFSGEKAAEIKKTAVDHMASKAMVPDDKQLLKFMKLFGVLEFFKKLKSQARETVFDENSIQTKAAV